MRRIARARLMLTESYMHAMIRIGLRACGLVSVAAFLLACNSAQSSEQDALPLTMAFERALLLEDSAYTSANVSIGDLNGDGHLDIALVKGRHWPLHDLILIGDGAGNFEPARQLGRTADRSYSGELVDVDDDGDLDVVVSNDSPDRKLVYLNDGEGNFTAGPTFGRAAWPTRHVSLALLNGDSLPDIVVANRYGERTGYNYVCFNRGGGRFETNCLAFSSESATSITPADFDRDGLVDLGVPHRDGGQSYIYLNDADHSFSHRIPFGPPDAAIRQAEAVDVNGDDALDLVIIDERTGAATLLAQDDGTFGEPIPLGEQGPTPYALATGDLDGDGRADIIVGYVNARPTVFFGDGAGGFTPVYFGDAEGTAYGFAIGDIDEDGVMDIAMARSDAPNVLYFGSFRKAGRR